MIQQIINKIRNVITKSKIVDAQKDDVYAYSANILTYGQTTNTEIYYPYGYASSAPVNAVTLTFLVGGHPENKTSLPYDPTTRFTGLSAGETIVGNQITQTFIKFNSDGTVIIVTDDTLMVTGNTIVSGNLTVQGTDTIIDGNMLIKGDLTVEGMISSVGNISSSDGELADQFGSMSTIRSVYNGHDHDDPQGGITGAPNQPM